MTSAKLRSVSQISLGVTLAVSLSFTFTVSLAAAPGEAANRSINHRGETGNNLRPAGMQLVEHAMEMEEAPRRVLVRVKPGVTAQMLADGRWTFSSDNDAPKDPLARAASVQAIAAVIRHHNVQAVEKPRGARAPRHEAAAQQIGLDRYYVLRIAPGSDPNVLAGELRAFNDMFESVQVDGIGGIAGLVPGDPDFNEQWNMHNIGQSGGVFDADIDAPEAWTIHQGTSDLVIAVLDTGVQSDHPDLIGRVILGPPIWTCSNPDDPACNTSEDYHGHGTHVAGIIAAKGNNGIGIAGMNWHAKILSVRVVSPFSGAGTETDLADGIIWAVDNGAHIINMSLQYYTGTDYLRDAVAYAHDNGVLPIAATGNNAPSGIVAYPAKFPKCMAVGATDDSDNRYNKSNTGPEIDVAAPGESVFSLWIESGYRLQSGTSMATPHVSGLASLMMSLNPDLSIQQIEQIIKDTTEDRGVPGFDHQFGHGRINAHFALLAAQPATPCPSDVTGDGMVNVDDLLAVISSWGLCPFGGSCDADIAPEGGNGIVNVDDLLAVISAWGVCAP